MAVDYSALLGLSVGIQVAKGDYDFARDGGAVGDHPLSAQSLPGGAVPVQIVQHTTTELDGTGNWTARLMLRNQLLTDPAQYLGVHVQTPSADTSPDDLPVQRTPFLSVTDDPLTVGAFTFWILYLPT